MDQTTDLADLLRPAVTQLVSQLKAQSPETPAEDAAQAVTVNLWAEIERKMREQFERDLHAQAVDYNNVVRPMAVELWDA